MFDPGFAVGDVVTNEQMRLAFKVGNMGGMRRSTKTGTLVIVSDRTKGFYHDKWRNGILYYTGMGKYGDQVLNGNQNRTLYDSDTNGVEVHLFEVLKPKLYMYYGVVKLANKPYTTDQPDEEGRVRKVWIFPVKPVSILDAESNGIIDANVDERITKHLSYEELDERIKTDAAVKGPKQSTVMVYHRDPYLKEVVKRLSEGKCQLCGSDAPFIDHSGEPYLEVHHVKRLADNGTDTIDNIVAICPNCHRKIHILGGKLENDKLEKEALENKRRFERLLEYKEKFDGWPSK